MKNTSHITIIIVNYNGWRDTIKCLQSIETIDYPSFNIIVVDNRSSDQSIKKINGYISSSSQRIDLIESAYNFGFSGGNNLGIHRALREEAEYVLLLNNDTIVDSNVLAELVAIAKKDSRIGFVGPKVMYEHDKRRIWSAGGKFGWIIGSSHLRENEFDTKTREKPMIVDWSTGAALFVKTSVIRDIGMMDFSYFLYFEDVDWALRARRRGYLCAYAPRAYVYHKVSKSVRRVGSGYIARYHFRNALILVEKNAPLGIKLLMPIWSGMILLREGIRYLLVKARREESGPAMQGIIDYWLHRAGKI